ncbi:MAG TPA: hypothetical protein VGI88_00585, partial [Verrucomicrobiae bacterium]
NGSGGRGQFSSESVVSQLCKVDTIGCGLCAGQLGKPGTQSKLFRGNYRLEMCSEGFQELLL